MCGIVGFSHATRTLPQGTLDSAVASLVHRGPDQQGCFRSPNISLAATRLRVMDLTGGDQPLRSADGDAVLVFNGEISNHGELRAELERLGARFRSSCDSEVVLSAFLAWGNECFARFRGMFAIAIWVQSANRLTLARDRSGIKPLYYRHHEGEIFFASELKCILAHPDVPRKLNLQGLDCFLSMNYVPAPFTLIEGIHKLLPGHLLQWEPGLVVDQEFVPRQSHAAVPIGTADAVAELDRLMGLSVAENMASDVPVGLWLSGGLDSSTILHYAHQHASKPLKTFSVSFEGRSFDDGLYAREVAEYYGTEHENFDLHPGRDLVEAIEEITYYSDEPNGDAGSLPLWFLSKMTRQKATVALSGEGADELFGGYLTYKADKYRRYTEHAPARLRQMALKQASRLPVSDEKIGFEYKIKRFLRGTLLSAEEAHIFWNGIFSKEEKRDLLVQQLPASLQAVLATMQPRQGLGRYLEFDQRFYLPDDILYKVDRISMAHALEVRPPFLDTRIVAFAASLPETLKLRGRESKYLLRRLMAGKLPHRVLRRPKVGLDIPIHQWFRGPLRALLLETLSEQSVLDTGLFSWPYVNQLIQSHLEKRANVGYHLWGLMTLLLWMKYWKIERPQQEPAVVTSSTALGEADWLLL